MARTDSHKRGARLARLTGLVLLWCTSANALLAQPDGHYAMLYNTYFRHQSIDYRPAGLDELLAFKPGAEIPSDPQGDD